MVGQAGQTGQARCTTGSGALAKQQQVGPVPTPPRARLLGGYSQWGNKAVQPACQRQAVQRRATLKSNRQD
jgi:hypothetical protein